MTWQSSVQLRDLPPETRIELTCRKCGKVRFATVAQWLALGDFGHLWLDEAQARAKCRQRGCGGGMRLALGHGGEAKGFVGGIA